MSGEQNERTARQDIIEKTLPIETFVSELEEIKRNIEVFKKVCGDRFDQGSIQNHLSDAKPLIKALRDSKLLQIDNLNNIINVNKKHIAPGIEPLSIDLATVIFSLKDTLVAPRIKLNEESEIARFFKSFLVRWEQFYLEMKSALESLRKAGV